MRDEYSPNRPGIHPCLMIYFMRSYSPALPIIITAGEDSSNGTGKEMGEKTPFHASRRKEKDPTGAFKGEENSYLKRR